MKSKYVDNVSAINVIAGVYNNPNLLDDDKYRFYEELFTEDIHRVLFNSIYNLHMLGNKEINLLTIEDYLSSRPNKLSIYKAFKGADLLLEYREKFKDETFPYYYDRLTKFCLLREYDKIGLDLSDIYDINNLFDQKKKEKQEDWLANVSLADIAKRIDDKIEDIKNRYAEGGEDNSCSISYGIDDFLESLKQSPGYGYPLYGKYINTITRGARKGKLYLRSAATNVGKAIPNDVTIPTPNGYKLVKEIRPGDLLWGSNGKPTKVIQIHPQKEQKYIYNVYFEDGRIAECCEDHLWEVYYKGHRGDSHSTLDVKTLLSKANASVNGFKGGQGRGYKWKTPVNKEVEYRERKLPIDPYILGLFLGDGSFRYNETNKALSFSSQDKELTDTIAARMNWTAKKNSANNYTYYFEYNENKEHKNVWVEEFLSSYPELWQAKSETKYIPEEYLISSIEQRYELLAGLLDTDGSIDSKGTISYFTVSDKLKNQVKELCYSLGFKVSELLDSRTEKYTTGKCWRLIIQSQNSKKLKLFKLSRKLEIAKKNFEEKGEGREYKRYFFNNIINIERTEIKTDMTCFTVDAEDHLFLMNNYIVTHNTRAMIGDACPIGCNMMWDNEKEIWITTGAAQPTLFIATEQSLDEIQLSFLACISGVNEEHIATQEFYAGEQERVMKAVQILKNSKIIFEAMPDFSLGDIENAIKRSIREYDVEYCFMDYIHTSIGILAELTKRGGGVKLREDNVLFMMATQLKNIAAQYDIFIMSSTQLNSGYQDAEVYDQNLLRGAKAIADSIDIGMIMLETTQKDREALEPMCKKLGVQIPNIKMSVYKNRANKWKNILVWINADRGICHFDPVFITNYNYEIEDITDVKIKVAEEGMF